MRVLKGSLEIVTSVSLAHACDDTGTPTSGPYFM